MAFAPKPAIPALNIADALFANLVVSYNFCEVASPFANDAGLVARGANNLGSTGTISTGSDALYGGYVQHSGLGNRRLLFSTFPTTGPPYVDDFVIEAIYSQDPDQADANGSIIGLDTVAGLYISSLGKVVLSGPEGSFQSGSMSYSTWHHALVASRKIVEGGLYGWVDGEVFAKPGQSAGQFNCNAMLNWSDGSATFKGKLALLRYWKNKVMTQDEASRLFADPWCLCTGRGPTRDDLHNRMADTWCTRRTRARFTTGGLS